MDHNFFVPAYGRWATISLRLCAFTREKKKKNKSRKVVKAQRQSAAAESHTEWTTISLRLPTAGRALRLCEKKEKKRIGRPVILRGRLQSRQAAKSAAADATLRLGEKKKEKNKSRKVGKPQRACPRRTGRHCEI
jgi:hypothetical protein